MVDKDLILAKAGSVKRHIDRIKAKSVTDMAIFLQDLDRQESMAFNMHLAIQNCMDMPRTLLAKRVWGFQAVLVKCSFCCMKMAFYPPILPREW